MASRHTRQSSKITTVALLTSSRGRAKWASPLSRLPRLDLPISNGVTVTIVTFMQVRNLNRVSGRLNIAVQGSESMTL